jgi:hypothetical protein
VLAAGNATIVIGRDGHDFANEVDWKLNTSRIHTTDKSIVLATKLKRRREYGLNRAEDSDVVKDKKSADHVDCTRFPSRLSSAFHDY